MHHCSCWWLYHVWKHALKHWADTANIIVRHNMCEGLNERIRKIRDRIFIDINTQVVITVENQLKLLPE